MNRVRILSLLLLLPAGLAAVSSAVAAESRRNSSSRNSTPPPADPAAKTFESFQLVIERNIFNPNRIGRTRTTAEEKPLRVDEISLVGTLQFDRETLALFDSPDAAFRKALHEGESVGDFKVQHITADSVDLLRADKPVTLKVAQQLRRVEGGDWSVTANQAARADPRALAAGAGAATGVRPVDPTAPPEIPADASEVLKRLMKKREKQLK